MKIIKQREFVEVKSYRLCFQWKDGSKHHGFSFPSDKDGNVNFSEMCEAGIENYNKCISGEHDVIPMDVECFEHEYTEPAIGECVCGEEVQLDGFTNTCDKCGRDYNSSGQELANREQWGCETGESLSDILRIR